MMRAIVGISTATAFLIAVSTSAVAQQTARPTTQTAAKTTPDPNEVVCEKEEDTGSRIQSSKVCMTRSQWAEQKRLNRKDIDKIQVQRPTH